MGCILTAKRGWTMLSLICMVASFMTAYASVEVTIDEGGPISVTDSGKYQTILSGVTELLDTEADTILPLINDINQKMAEMTDTVKSLESLEKIVEEKESNINSMIDEINIREMENLVGRLKETLERETNLRELERKERERQKELVGETELKMLEDENNFVDMKTLVERLDTDVILSESENKMKEWILTLVDDEMDKYKKDILEKIEKSKGSSDDHDSDSENIECPSLIDIVQQVQQALNVYADDGIGITDHAQGSAIVHWLTSDTHTPSVVPSKTLGNVWWNKFIPQDWERLLPHGWESWEVGIPSYVYHSLPFLSGDVAPPEAIVQKSTIPGSCWPMKGSTGQVVIRLPYPVVVESISVDHVSSKIVPREKRDTAPKRLKIVGYPSCDEMKSNCGAVGFDLGNPIDIADIEYDVEGMSVQTFESHYAKAMASVPKPKFDDIQTDSGSCSVQASCSTPPKISVTAIEVKVLENWGNPDYTCLYRLRVHGDPEATL